MKKSSRLFCCTLFLTQNTKRTDRKKKNKENLHHLAKNALFLLMLKILRYICSHWFCFIALHGALYQYQTLYIDIDELMLKYRVSITSAFRMIDREIEMRIENALK